MGGWAVLLLIGPCSTCSFTRNTAGQDRLSWWAVTSSENWPFHRLLCWCRQVHQHSRSVFHSSRPHKRASFNSFRVQILLRELGDHTFFSLAKLEATTGIRWAWPRQLRETLWICDSFWLASQQISSFSLLGEAEGIAATFLGKAETPPG